MGTDVSITSTIPKGEPAFDHAFVLFTLAAVTSRSNIKRKERTTNIVWQRLKVTRAVILLVKALMTVLLFTERR